MIQLSKERLTVLLAFAAIYIVWGSTYLAIWIGLNDIPPFLMSGLRFLVAGFILHIWCWCKGETFRGTQVITRNTISGILMLVGGTVSVAWAEQYLSSSLAATIVTILPFWFVLLDRPHWNFYFSHKAIIAGLILGFAGVILLLRYGGNKSSSALGHSNQWLGVVVLLFGGIAWTVGSLYSKYKPAKSSLLANASVQLLASGFFCLLVSWLFGEWNHFAPQKIASSSWLALLYLIVMGSIVTYLSYLYLLKKRSPAQVSSYVYINPVIALLLGSFIANESITTLKIISLVIILGGVLLVNLPRYTTRTN